ncbi:MAG: cell division protein ZipA C-terminal FtsZ-binding domain-containing protein [Methylophilaceae bacterium]
MSDLQVVLIALGAFIIAGVVVYNWMQERKLRKNITDDFLVPQKDVLAEDFYIDAEAYAEQALADVPNKNKIMEKLNAPMTVPEIELTEVSEPPINRDKAVEAEITKSKEIEVTEHPVLSIAEPSAPVPLPVAKLEKESQQTNSPLPNDVHQQIDLTAFLYSTKNISLQTLSALTDAIASDLGVPMMMHGIDQEGKWHLLDTNTVKGVFKQIACSLQLADRSGPVSKNKLNKFQFAIENMGLELSAHVEWQGTGDAMQRAIELDKFCMEVDQLVSVHLVQGESPVHGTKFRGLAEACGMRLGEDGKFSFYASSAVEVPQFVLVNADNQPFTADTLRNSVVKSVAFQIEIPKVSSCEQVFNQMIAVAQKMASSLGARIVDDNQKPLGDLQIEKIRQQLKVIHATMVARGVMPGSASSMRLFN